ncbi:hypothetical protein BKA70DRAFT_170771 [Coprinopsis sp. MPI-PUGE-AT-0042]|nr:hypothetical protein BKA70DRAFT_170771 [Coprinopsis sp. MPI-PUGE-AT-0042]
MRSTNDKVEKNSKTPTIWEQGSSEKFPSHEETMEPTKLVGWAWFAAKGKRGMALAVGLEDLVFLIYPTFVYFASPPYHDISCPDVFIDLFAPTGTPVFRKWQTFCAHLARAQPPRKARNPHPNALLYSTPNRIAWYDENVTWISSYIFWSG